MEINEIKSPSLRGSSGSPRDGPLPNITGYTGGGGGPAAPVNGQDDCLACAGCQQSDMTGSASREFVAPTSPVITYRIQQQQQQPGLQQYPSYTCGQQPTQLQQQMQHMKAPPQTAGSSCRCPEGRVDTGSPLLGSRTVAPSGLQQPAHSPRQHTDIFLQQQAPAPLCTSSRGSPIASTASTPPLPQAHGAAATVAPALPYVSPRGTSPVLKDLSGLLGAVGSDSAGSRSCALASSSGVVPFGAAGLPAAVHTLGNLNSGGIDRQEEEGRAATSAAANVQALQQFVQNGGCLVPLPEARRQHTMAADVASKEPLTTDAIDLKNCRNENEEAKRFLQQQQPEKGEASFLPACAAQLEKLSLMSQRERGESPLRQPGAAESLLGQSRTGSRTFEDFLSQVHKLLRSSSTSSASSASTPRVFGSGRPATAPPHTPLVTTPIAQAARFRTEGVDKPCTQKWDNNKEQGSGREWGHDFLGDEVRNSAVAAAGQTPNKHEDDGHKTTSVNNGSPTAPLIDIAIVQAVAASLGANIRGVQGGFPLSGNRDGMSQSPLSPNLELATVLMLPELQRQAAQQRTPLHDPRAADGGNGHDSDFLQTALKMLEEGKHLTHKEPQQQAEQQQQQPEHQQYPSAAIPTVQLSPSDKRQGSPQGLFPHPRTPGLRAGSGRLLPPPYQTCDEIQSAPNPSTPIIRGSDKISVEQFLMSFPFTRTMDYTHAALKFCADHNLVVKLLGYHGKRVELLERQYCCRIQTSAQASSFPGYPNGRCVLFTGGLTSLLRACSDLYAVVDTSSPGLRTNIEGYRVCLVVPGDFVGRLLRSNCAGLHALQEVGGRSVHIALGNLCVVMRGNYSERVLLIDGNLEGVCQVLEYTAAQLQDFLRRYEGCPGPALGSSQSLLTRYEFLDYPKRIELHLST